LTANLHERRRRVVSDDVLCDTTESVYGTCGDRKGLTRLLSSRRREPCCARISRPCSRRIEPIRKLSDLKLVSGNPGTAAASYRPQRFPAKRKWAPGTAASATYLRRFWKGDDDLQLADWPKATERQPRSLRRPAPRPWGGPITLPCTAHGPASPWPIWSAYNGKHNLAKWRGQPRRRQPQQQLESRGGRPLQRSRLPAPLRQPPAAQISLATLLLAPGGADAC